MVVRHSTRRGLSRKLRFRTRAKQATERLFFSTCGLPTIQVDQVAPPLDESAYLISDHKGVPPNPTWSHDDTTPFLRILRDVAPGNVLEYGTGRGNLTANICANSDAHVYTVNALPEMISGKYITFALPEEQIGIVYRLHGFEQRVTQIYVDTLNFEPDSYLKGKRVDFVVIDACHDAAYVINDFIKALPVLAPKAIVLFHDTHSSRKGHLSGSYDACVDLRGQGFDIRQVAGTWWAIWQSGSAVGRSPRRFLCGLMRRSRALAPRAKPSDL